MAPDLRFWRHRRSAPAPFGFHCLRCGESYNRPTLDAVIAVGRDHECRFMGAIDVPDGGVLRFDEPISREDAAKIRAAWAEAGCG